MEHREEKHQAEESQSVLCNSFKWWNKQVTNSSSQEKERGGKSKEQNSKSDEDYKPTSPAEQGRKNTSKHIEKIAKYQW